MGATYIVDPKAKDRSPMLRQLTLCNGQQTGFECRHYWRQVVRMNVLNPDSLRKGKTLRYCKAAIMAPDHDMAMFIEGDTEMAVECTEYRRDITRPFQDKVDDYDPLTPAQITALQDGKAVPRFKPKRWWQFWRRHPRVDVVYLTPEELAELTRVVVKTGDPDGDNVFGGTVFDEKDTPLSDAGGSTATTPMQVAMDTEGRHLSKGPTTDVTAPPLPSDAQVDAALTEATTRITAEVPVIEIKKP